MCSFAASSISYESYLSDMISSMTSLSYNSNNDESNNDISTSDSDFKSNHDNNIDDFDDDLDDDFDENDNDGENFNKRKDYKVSNSYVQKSLNKLTSFSISDGELLCIMSFDGIQFTNSSYNPSISANTVNGTISNNNNFTIFINFMVNNRNRSLYSFIKIKLVQKEFHLNGTRLNDKIINEKIINIKYLIKIKQLINIINNVTTTFSCPAFYVRFIYFIYLYNLFI